VWFFTLPAKPVRRGNVWAFATSLPEAVNTVEASHPIFSTTA
jgi:hypothetical protein